MTARIVVTDDIAACLALRRAVFIEEQGIPEVEELDELDGVAIHLLARYASGRPVGTARILVDNQSARIGRVCVLADQRGTGLGAALMATAIEEVSKIPGMKRIRLSAQVPVLGFYTRLGFEPFGPEYDDAGIPHRSMERWL